MEFAEDFLQRNAGFVFSDELESYEVHRADFHGQSAATGKAAVAHFCIREFDPGRGAVDRGHQGLALLPRFAADFGEDLAFTPILNE